MSNDALASSEETPNHMIVWFDLNIGRRDDYKQLKAAFSTTADPQHVNPVKLIINKDDEEINRAVGPQKVDFEGVKFLLAAFTNIEQGVEFLQKNQDKRIFIIISGQMGRVAVPLIHHKCPKLFIDPITNKPFSFIYVFCHDITLNMDWISEYLEHVKAFNFDADLLVRMIRDIANYFVAQGNHQLEANPPQYSTAYKRLTWAYILYDRYRILENNAVTKEFAEVNRLMEIAETGLRDSEAYD